MIIPRLDAYTLKLIDYLLEQALNRSINFILHQRPEVPELRRTLKVKCFRCEEDIKVP